LKGIVLAGGTGSRLYPVTLGVSKQLLPIFDKPMIYYPISVLMLAGIREILIVSTPEDIDSYRNLLGEGEKFGVKFKYMVQPKPEGIAQVFLLARKFINNSSVCLILGDNVFYGNGLTKIITRSISNNIGATIFGSYVRDPERFGVAKFDKNGNLIRIVEKPNHAISNYAVTGMYIYDKNVVEIAEHLKPSSRGEFEITDINNIYHEKGILSFERLGRGIAWLDTGTPESLLNASNFVETIETNQNQKIACLEEIALMNNWISREKLTDNIKKYAENAYKKYLVSVLDHEVIRN